MLTLEIARNFGAAVLLGLLIGMQRQYVKQKNNELMFAGVRTFSIISLLGALSVYISQMLGISVFIVMLAGYLLFIIAAYSLESYLSKDIGATGEISSMVTFLIGALCALDKIAVSVFVAITLTVLLVSKKSLHTFASKIKQVEVYSTLKFAIIAFIILPLLPNKAYGPYNVLNPYIIWLMVVLITGISFLAYILIKAFGAKRGIGITGFLGGLISSTAITTSLSSQSKKVSLVNPFVFGIIIAGATMFIRVLIEVSILNYDLLQSLLIPIGVMGVIGFIAAAFFWFRKEKPTKEIHACEFSSPFTMGPAVKFAILFAVILFISKAGQVLLGNNALYGISFFSGLVDIDAITVSMANLSRTGDIPMSIATTAIIIAATANTLTKAGIVYFMGSRNVSKKVMLIFGLVVLAGMAALFLV